MSNNLSTATIPDDCYAVILDAVQRAIIDKYASKATRKAAFSALLALIEAGVVAGETPVSSTARDTDDSPLFVMTWYSIATVIVTTVGCLIGRKLLRW